MRNNNNFTNVTKLTLSSHLRVIENPNSDDVILYHSLYWLPFVCDKEILDYLYNRNWVTFFDLDNEIQETLKQSRIFVNTDDELNEFKLLTDKYQSKAVNWENISNLDLLVSEACNLWCPHCILFNSLDSWDTNRKNKLMKRDQAKKILDEYVQIIKNNNWNKLNIHFWSWEPLLNRSVIVKTVEYIESRYPDFKKEFSINTNLTLLTSDMAEYLRDHMVDTHVSLDWLKESNDKIRINKQWKGTYDSIIDWIDLLEDVWYPLTWISLTITDKNFDLVGTSFIDRCKQRWMNNIAMDIDLISTISIHWVTIEMVINKLTWLYNYAENNWIEVIWTRLTPYLNLKNKSILEWDSVFFCSAVKWKNLAVSRDWNVTTCSYTTTSIWNIFSLSTWEDSELWHLVKSRIPWSSDYCRWCSIEWHCAWQCHVTKEISKSSWNPALIHTMCEFYRWVTHKLLSDELE